MEEITPRSIKFVEQQEKKERLVAQGVNFMTVYQIEDDSDNDQVPGDTGGSARRKKRIMIPTQQPIQALQERQVQNEDITPVVKAKSTNRKLKLDLKKLAGEQQVLLKIGQNGMPVLIRDETQSPLGNLSSRSKPNKSEYAKKKRSVISPPSEKE